MAKTKSQVISSQVKKEEHEDKPRLNKPLRSTKSKITKNGGSQQRFIQPQINDVKLENIDDNKISLTSTLADSRRKRIKTAITAEQIGKLINYIVNDKMKITAASRKAGMSQPTAMSYYQEYQNDPEHKIPIPRTRLSYSPSVTTPQKLENLIHYIVHDKMNLTQAAKKAQVNRRTADKYYKRYREDPEHKIPTLDTLNGGSFRRCTHDQIKQLIDYVVNDNMSVISASKKVNMSEGTAQMYYLKYLQDPSHQIPSPKMYRNKRGRNGYTDGKKESVIGYIIRDGMTVLEASVKANVTRITAAKYYQQYLKNSNRNTPAVMANNIPTFNEYVTFDQAKKFFSSIIVDELNVIQAACNANISEEYGYALYKKYVIDFSKYIKTGDRSYSEEKMKKIVEYVQNGNMSMKLAAEKVNLNYCTACKYYREYLLDPQHRIPTTAKKDTQDVEKLIGYIENDKMTVRSAAIKVKMMVKAAYKYYRAYQNDPEHKVKMPLRVPIQRKYVLKNKTDDMYIQIVTDIYNNNPSIEPFHLDSEVSKTIIKQEPSGIKEELKVLV